MTLVCENVGYSYPDGNPALKDVNFQIASGERVALLGPNGAGKSTLALCLNGILTPTEGHVAINGMRVSRDTLPAIRRAVGIVFQDPDDQLFAPTVADDVAFGPINLGLTGDALHARVTEALKTMRLTELGERTPQALSAGQQRRAAIAGILSMHPDYLVLDEPSSTLDPFGRRELAEHLLELPYGLLLITHDLPYALQLCPRSLILDEGRIVADAPTRTLLGDTDLLARHRLELPFGMVLS